MNKRNVANYSDANAVRYITPKHDFYKLYSNEQICDIVNNLEIYREVPRQYNYFDKGASRWAEYVKRLASEDNANTLTSTIGLLETNENCIDYLLHDFSNVNIIDVGAGNGYPVKGLISYLLGLGKLGRYLALDISPAMLKLVESNISEWFDDKITFEGHVYDVSQDRFSDLLNQNESTDLRSDNINLILLLGGTISNLRNPDYAYKMIHGSMRTNDILVHVTKLDTEISRKYFDFNASSDAGLSPNHRFVFELLNIDEDLYDVEMDYDHSNRERYIRVRLKVAIEIKFVLNFKERKLFMHKGCAILVWRGVQHTKNTIIQQFYRNNFDMIHISQTDDQDYLLTISRASHDKL